MLPVALLAIIGGLGVFMIITHAQWEKSPRPMDEHDRRYRAALGEEAAKLPKSYERQSSLTTAEDTIAGFVGNTQHSGLKRAIELAELPVTVGQFWRVGLGIAFLAGAVVFLVTGGILVSLFVAAGSIAVYVWWLFWRRDTIRLEYDESLSDACDRLAMAAEIQGAGLSAVFQNTLKLVPENVRDDFDEIARRLGMNESPDSVFAVIKKRRKSAAFALMADALSMWGGAKEGTKKPLNEVLKPLSRTLRRNAAERRRVESELAGSRTQMFIVSVFPLVFVALLRFSSQDFARVYSSLIGEVIQIVAFTLAAIGVFMGNRALGEVRRLQELEPPGESKKKQAVESFQEVRVSPEVE